jgi:DNA-binding LacI/PurR family transcriptional regulator
MATIRDIAKVLSVSPMTVSYALRHDKRIRPEVRQRVHKAARAMGYRVNAAARAMCLQRTFQIGVLVRNDDERPYASPFDYETIIGINQGFERQGYIVSIIRLDDIEKDTPTSARLFGEWIFDGVIVLGNLRPSVRQRASKIASSCVWLDSNVMQPTQCIRRDERYSGQVIATRAAECGYTRWLWFQRAFDEHPRNEEPHYSLQARHEAICEVAAQRRIPVETIALVDDWAVRDQVKDMRHRLTPETAILCYDIRLAQRFAHAAGRLGLIPGRHFGLACCDDANEIEQTWPELSRMLFSRYEMGQAAARMMLSILNGATDSPSEVLRGSWYDGETLPPVGQAGDLAGRERAT